MCGILGFNWNDKKLAQELGELIAHRGPDQNGVFSNKQVTLGHRRLSILDLSKKGIQPMKTKNGKFIISFNGEIFNYVELREDLISKGYTFKSKTDTEVLLYGYQEYGKDFVKKLNGQFAFCVYDVEREELFLARDQVGINPLYYYFKDSKFIFGSELKVIMESGISKEIDEFSLNYYLMYGYTPRKRCIIKDAFKLEPGHYMVFDLKSSKIKEYKQYWKYKITESIKDESKASRLILNTLDEAVKKRMVADVPVGAFLSGGVDSSAIVALMSKYTKNLNTFSVKFDHDDFDESSYADIISKKFKTNHHVIEFTAKDVKKLIPKLVYHYDEPFADPSMIPTFLVSQVARQHVTVSLSGDGGDELFGGYTSYKHYNLLNAQKYYPKFFNVIAYRILEKFSFERLEKPKAFFELGMLERSQKFARVMSYLNYQEFVSLTGKNPSPFYSSYGREFKKGESLNEAILIDINNYLSSDILTKVDRASLGVSLESRPPILDIDMLELSGRVDSSLKIKSGESKYILKKSLEGVLPHEILYRKKQGFGVPLKHYFRNELRGFVEKYVINYRGHNYFREEYLNEIVSNLNKKHWDKDYSRVIWSILMFNMWYAKWFQ